MAAGTIWLALATTIFTRTVVQGDNLEAAHCQKLSFDYLPQISKPTCFSAELGEGLISADEAQRMCRSLDNGDLPSVETKVSILNLTAPAFTRFFIFVCPHP